MSYVIINRWLLNLSVHRIGAGSPDDSLVFKDDKVYLPIVRNNRLHPAEVSLGHDNGIDVVVSGDVHDGDLVAMSVRTSRKRRRMSSARPAEDKQLVALVDQRSVIEPKSA